LSSVAEDFLTKERGIDPVVFSYYPVEFKDDTIKYGYNGGSKYRKVLPNGDRKTWQEGDVGLFWGNRMGSATKVIITEGETDCLRLAGMLDADDPDYTVVACPGVDGFTERALNELREWGTTEIYIVLDNDVDYRVKAQVEAAWDRMRKTLTPKPRRVRLPPDVKDVCEFFDSYSVTAFRSLLHAAGDGAYHYTPLDLTKEPPPYDWLLEGLICRGDVVILQGEPNVGKSFFTMGLTAAIAEGQDKFLNHKLHPKYGKVIYVDEENPEDVVRGRLKQLGLTPGNANVRYLYRQGIRLDSNSKNLLLDEALAFQPDLIVLDSLTRLHSGNENEAGTMARLFNDGINPLARETGAAVVFLHHTNKSESNSSYSKARGSTDITASPDTGLELRKLDSDGQVNLVHFKSRRGKVGVSTPFFIRELDQDTVRLVTVPDEKGW
jgi:hypothetical protein